MDVIVPAYKKVDPQLQVNNIIKYNSEIMEQILDDQLKNKVHEAHSRFWKGRSAKDYTFTMKEIIDKPKLKGESLIFFFLDLKTSFDKVPREKIWKIF